jgi:hypothetical protein
MPGEKNSADSLSELLCFLEDFCSANPGCTKEQIALATAQRFQLGLKRSVYSGNDFAIRFSTASGPSFSNVVLSLSALRLYDRLPFLVCVVRPTGIELLLANSTFLRKISHSSHQLRIDNERGSFLGHDIVRSYEGTLNRPEHFSLLFSIHEQFTWEENLARLVEATTNIAPSGVRFTPTLPQRTNILSSADLAHRLSRHPDYLGIERNLTQVVAKQRIPILEASLINNINVRGNQIEQIITEAANVHGAEDITFTLKMGSTLLVDIKTKVITLSSSPKGYNIDKLLIKLSPGNTVFSFFFVGLNPASRSVATRLVSVVDSTILDCTRIQFHWAGRNSRGVTQLTGNLLRIFAPTFSEHVDVDQAKLYLQKLIDLPATR